MAGTRLEDLPAHVKAKLTAAGAVDFSSKGPPAIARAMRIECPGCGATVVRGLLPMPTPWPVDADPLPLSRHSEVLALLAGRRTYDLAWRYDRLELSSRGNWHFHLTVPTPRTDIVAAHRCGARPAWPGTPSAIPSRLFTKLDPVPGGLDPPF